MKCDSSFVDDRAAARTHVGRNGPWGPLSPARERPHAGPHRRCVRQRASSRAVMIDGVGRELEIRTARLLLRSFRVTDVDDALAYRDDLEFARFLPHIPVPFTRADA